MKKREITRIYDLMLMAGLSFLINVVHRGPGTRKGSPV